MMISQDAQDGSSFLMDNLDDRKLSKHFNVRFGAIQNVENLIDIDSEDYESSQSDDDKDGIQVSSFDQQSYLLLKKLHQEASELLQEKMVELNYHVQHK